MNIYFLETECVETDFFKKALPEHDLHFVKSMEAVGDDAEALSLFIYSPISEPFLDSHPRLRFIATRSTGYDHVNLPACKARDIKVSFVPSYGDNTVAEHAFALILALSRRLREAMQPSKGSEFSFEAMRGFDLKDKTLGIVGSGRIGLHAIRIAKAFGMKVVAYDLNPQPFMAELLGFDYAPFDELLARSDIISLHIPAFPGTYHLLNRAAFAKCKRGVVIVNTARGSLIDTEALIEALDSGIVRSAGLDVLEDERVFQQETIDLIGSQILDRLHSDEQPSELRTSNFERINELQRIMRNADLIARPNVVFTPHIAFNSVEAVERINTVTAENIRAFCVGSPVNLVE